MKDNKISKVAQNTPENSGGGGILTNCDNSQPVVIVLSCDENYAPYCGATIESIIRYKSKGRKYEFYILITQITIETLNKLESLTDVENKIKVKCIDIRTIANNFNKLFKVSGRFTKETYYRIYIPRIFKDYKRVLYLDCDIVCLDNIEEYFDLEFNDKLILAPRFGIRRIPSYDYIINYYENVLKLNSHKMFCAGQLLMDIPKLIEFKFEEKIHSLLLQAQKQNVTLLGQDQDALNLVCKDVLGAIDLKFGYTAEFDTWNDEEFVSPEDCLFTRKARDEVKLIHYAGKSKPWNIPETELSGHFWVNAKESIFYQQIISKILEFRVNTLLKQGNIFSREEYKKNLLEFIDKKIENI